MNRGHQASHVGKSVQICHIAKRSMLPDMKFLFIGHSYLVMYCVATHAGLRAGSVFGGYIC